jgi:hypothetical protein
VNRRRIVFVGLAIGCLAFPGVAIGKYRLRVVQASLQSPYVFWGEPAQLRFQVHVKNFGPGESPAGFVGLYIYRHGKVPPTGIAGYRIPSLRQGLSHIQRVGAGSRRQLLALPPGLYNVQVCVAARNAKNVPQAQCHALSHPLAIIARAWAATLTSVHPDPYENGVFENMASRGARFNFSAFHPPGTAIYKLNGTIQINDSGTSDQGCTRTGSFVASNPPGVLTLDYSREDYSGLGSLQGIQYPIFSNCDDHSPREYGPLDGVYFVTDEAFGSAGGQQPLPFGATKLSGSFTLQDGSVTSTWSLSA